MKIIRGRRRGECPDLDSWWELGLIDEFGNSVDPMTVELTPDEVDRWNAAPEGMERYYEISRVGRFLKIPKSERIRRGGKR